MTMYSRSAPLTVALHEFHVFADAVLLVHDVVARLQLQRVDRVAPPARHLAHVLHRGAATAGDVVAGQHDEAGDLVDEPVGQAAGRDDRRARLRRRGDAVGLHDADARVAQHLDRALGRAVPLEDDRDTPAVGGPARHVVDDACRLAVIERDGLRADRDRTALVWRDVAVGRLLPLAPRFVGLGVRVVDRDAERGQGPPGQLETAGGRADLGQRLEGDPADVDGRLAIGRRRRRSPAGLQKLFTGAHQVVRACANALRVAQHHVGLLRHAVEQEFEVVGAVEQGRRERLHALDRDALGQLVEDLGQLGVRLGQCRRLLAHLGRQQQLAAGGRPEAIDLLDGALVGDGEGADVLHVVAPELDAHRVLIGRREDVEQATADGELASLGDQVDARVGEVGEPVGDLVQIGRAAGPQLHRFEVAEALELRLEHRAHRRDDDPDRRRARHRSGSGWASRRSTPRRRPTVSERGDRRSCGSVSQAGKTATWSAGRRSASAVARSSASRVVAVTASTGRPESVRAASRPSAAIAATTKGRMAAGPVRSTCSAAGPPSRARRAAVARPVSARAASSRPMRFTGTPSEIRAGHFAWMRKRRAHAFLPQRPDRTGVRA